MKLRRFYILTLLLLFNHFILVAQQSENQLGRLESQIDRATELRENYNYDDALLDFNSVLVSLENAESNEAMRLKAKTYIGISQLFMEIELFEDALDYNQRGLELYKRVGEENSIVQSYNKRGSIYFYYYHSGSGDFSLIESARDSYLKALKLNTSSEESKIMLSSLYNNISNTYLAEEKLNSAIKWAEQGRIDASKKNNTYNLATSNMLLSRIYLDLGQYQKALFYSLDRIADVEEKQDLGIFLDSYYYNIYQAYSGLGEKEKAFEYLEKRTNILDNKESISEKDFASIVTTRETNRIREKAKELEANLFQKEKQATKIQRTNIVLWLLLGSLALLGLNFYRGQELKRKNLELELNKQEQQAELDLVNAMIDGKETERKEIGRFLHDHVTALVNAANIQLEVMANEANLQENKKLNTTQSILDDIADKVRNLSHQLLSNVLQKYGLEVAFEEMCEQLSSNNIKFSIESELPAGKRYNDAMENKLYGIAQELCNNVLKHSNADNASIKLNETDTDLLMTVADNGKGFEESDIKAGGVGLHQIKARVNSIGGNLEIFSNGMTKVTISIPNEIAIQHSLT